MAKENLETKDIRRAITKNERLRMHVSMRMMKE